jgi:hypothetical protein
MQRHGLLLERYSGRRPGRVHDGKVVVMRSNLRCAPTSLRVRLLERRDRPGQVRDRRPQETRDFAGALGLQPCSTPVASPESNGLAKALVRTLKRDYVRVTRCLTRPHQGTP